MTMNKPSMKQAVVIAVAGALALGATTPSWAAPVLSSTTIVKQMAPSSVSDVRYRGRYYGNRGAGIALGVLGVVGAVAGAAAYGNGYYGDPGYYQQGYYGSPDDGYAYEPTYVGPRQRYHRGSNCAVEGAYHPDYSLC
jgi:hypothetical protein